MTDISFYFTPISFDRENYQKEQIGGCISAFTDEFPSIDSGSIAILYVPENRGSRTKQDQKTSSDFRKSFYQLYKGKNWNKSIFDLGDILPGNELKDTYLALSNVVAELVKSNVLPIIIGGSQDLVMGVYDAYAKLEQLVNICSIDYSLDLGDTEKEADSQSYLTPLMLKRPCYLFNHANIGLQIPYARPQDIKLFEKLFFDICRLGEFNSDFRKAEPHLRNADIINIDFKSIKASEVFAHGSNPNGFYAEQICQIARYAGIADKVNCLGVFNYNDLNAISDKLLADMLWYFTDGYFSRWGDFPMGSKAAYKRFTVVLEEGDYTIVFYKSNKSGRWWMEVPYPPKEGKKYERHYLVPCNREDYDRSMNNEMPDLWWKTYQKLC
jgi:formiminoglutamase